jgi:hypothetical protein
LLPSEPCEGMVKQKGAGTFQMRITYHDQVCHTPDFAREQSQGLIRIFMFFGAAEAVTSKGKNAHFWVF